MFDVLANEQAREGKSNLTNANNLTLPRPTKWNESIQSSIANGHLSVNVCQAKSKFSNVLGHKERHERAKANISYGN